MDSTREKTELKKGPWTASEDAILMEYVKKHGEGNWNQVQKNSGLARCGKSCRLRWANHLRPNLKKGAFSPEEERLIFELHAKLGNKWARMAAQLPGRTDNEIKNYWNTRVKRRLRQGLPLYPQDIQQNRSNSNFNFIRHAQEKQSLTKSPSTDSLLLSPTSPASPSLPLHLSPHQHLSNSYSSTPSLSLYHNPVSLTSTQVFTPIITPPILSSQFSRYKRYNRNFSLQTMTCTSQPTSVLVQPMPITPALPPFSALNQSMPATTYLQHSPPFGSSKPPQLPRTSSFSFDPLPYSQSMQNFNTQFGEESNGVLSTEDMTMSATPELPSNQLSPKPVDCRNNNIPIINKTATNSTTTNNNYNEMNIDVNAHNVNGGSGLLDDLLREAQVMSHNEESKKQDLFGWEQGKGLLDGFDGDWEFSFSDQLSAEPQVTKEEKVQPISQMDSVHEDLSSILSIMPPIMQQYSSWTGSIDDSSNGQYSYTTDENVGLDMFTSVTSSNWDNMPRIY